MKRMVGWLVLTGLMLFAVLRVPWRSTLEVAAGANPLWLLASVAANAAILLWITLRWQLFLPRTVKVPLRTMFSVVGLVASVSHTGPMVFGYAAGMRLLITRGGVAAAAAASVLVLGHLADSLAKLALAGLAVALMPASDYRVGGWLLLVSMPLVASGLAMLAHRPQLLEGLVARSWRPVAAVLHLGSRALTHLDTLRRPGHFGAAIALGLAKKGMEALGF